MKWMCNLGSNVMLISQFYVDYYHFNSAYIVPSVFSAHCVSKMIKHTYHWNLMSIKALYARKYEIGFDEKEQKILNYCCGIYCFKSWALPLVHVFEEYWCTEISFVLFLHAFKRCKEILLNICSIFLNWGLLQCRRILYQLSYQGSPFVVTDSNLITKSTLGLMLQWKTQFSFI